MKKLKRLLRLRNSAGFTLVEVVISCALLGVLILGVMGFITPVLRSVREKEMDARAAMLAQSINTYIGTTIQYAYFVSTVSGCSAGDTSGTAPEVMTAKYTGTEFSKKTGKGLSTLKATFDTLNTEKPNTYEIRCIGMRWRTDAQNKGEKKLMLTNEAVEISGDNLVINPSKTRLVFEECFYNGVYPVINFVNFDNQYQINGTDKVEADKVDIAPALGISTDVYINNDCYSVTDTVRSNAMSVVKNNAYVGFNNIKTPLINKGNFEVVPNIAVRSYDDAKGEDATKTDTSGKPVVYKDDEGNEFYYPEAFIYYIVRKTKLDTTTT